jgi:hypothetical protein
MVTQNRVLPQWNRHSHYHKAQNFHIGTDIDSITQQSTATLLQARTISHNRALPHWYRHCSYHKKENCYVGTGTDRIPQQSTATLLKALILSQHCDVTYLRDTVSGNLTRLIPGRILVQFSVLTTCILHVPTRCTVRFIDCTALILMCVIPVVLLQ